VSNRRTQIILVLAVLAALVGVALLAIPSSPVHKKSTLGLDLQGGIEVVLQAQPRPNQKLDSNALDRSENIIRQRIDKLGVSEPEVRKQGDNQIVVQLAGVFDQQRAVSIIGSTAALELYKMQDDLVTPSVNPVTKEPIANTSIYGLLSPVSSTAGDKGAGYYLFNPKKKLVAGPATSKAALLNTKKAKCVTGKRTGTACAKLIAAGGKPGKGDKSESTDGLLKGWKIFGRPANTKILTCDDSAVACPGLQTAPVKGTTYYYLFKYFPDREGQGGSIPEMTGKDLKLDGTRQDFDTQSGEPEVLMSFTGKGKGKFHDITRALAQDGRLRSSRIGQDVFDSFAIVLDNRSSRSRRSTSTTCPTASRATTARASPAWPD